MTIGGQSAGTWSQKLIRHQLGVRVATPSMAVPQIATVTKVGTANLALAGGPAQSYPVVWFQLPNTIGSGPGFGPAPYEPVPGWTPSAGDACSVIFVGYGSNNPHVVAFPGATPSAGGWNVYGLTESATIASGDCVFCDTAGGAFTVTVPQVENGRYKVVRATQVSQALTVAAETGYIYGAGTTGATDAIELDASYGAVELESDGTHLILTSGLLDSGWQSMSLANDFETVGAGIAVYRQIANRVLFIAQVTGTAGDVFWNWPSGLGPFQNYRVFPGAQGLTSTGEAFTYAFNDNSGLVAANTVYCGHGEYLID